MTFVSLLLVLAMIPAFVQFAHFAGLPRSTSLAVVAGIIALLAVRRK